MSKKQDVCPHCRVSLQGQAIPREYLEKGYYGKWDGKPQYYSRKIGIEVMGAYDGTLYYLCPDCGGRWHRFPEGHPLRGLAEFHIKEAV